MASDTDTLTLGKHREHGFEADWALLLNCNLHWSDSVPCLVWHWMLVQEHQWHE